MIFCAKSAAGFHAFVFAVAFGISTLASSFVTSRCTFSGVFYAVFANGASSRTFGAIRSFGHYIRYKEKILK